MKKLILIDGHALVHRAYHALPPLSTGQGELVNAVFGFSSILLKVLKDLRPDYIVATFDLAGPTFRHEKFEEYKATRVKAPDELYAQLKRVKDVLSAFNVPFFEKEGFEADDLIGTIARQVKKEKQKIETIIVTGDLDTLQLVDDTTKVFTLKKGVKDTIIYDAKAVKERFDLGPEQMNDYKGLKGDPSDNIPGVPGIGEKTATELLKKYGSLEKLYEELEKTAKSKKPALKNKKLYDKLTEFKDQAFFSKYLATIKTDVPIKFNLKEAVARDFEKEKVIKLFKELGFYSLVSRLPEDFGRGAAPEKIEEAGAVGSEVLEKIEQAYRDGALSPKIFELEKKLAPVISKMQKNGIKIDVSILKKIGKEVAQKIGELEEKIYDSAGNHFNIASPQQLSDMLFNKLKISVKGLKKTPGKVISTAAPELLKLQGEHPVIDLILEHRELAKLKNTYIDTLPELLGPDGRLHTTFDQLGAVTGRLSSKNPNLQNIPIKSKLGNEIRKAFVAEKGHKLLAGDYSQIELRVVACLAHDEKMIQALKAGQDIHLITAAEVFEARPEEVSAQMRNMAKVLNFGVIYGMSVRGFAQAAKVTNERAKEFIDKYFEEFSGVARFLERTKKEASEKGFVQTLFGRKRFIPEINSSVWNLRASAERMAINMPVQGTAADLIKMAMVEIAGSQSLIADCKMLLQVHDELIFEVPEEKVSEAAKEIKKIMENIYQLEVPLLVEMESGDNWGELEKLKIND